MNPRDFEQREELLVDLMADYDEALAADSSTNAFDSTAAELDPLLAAEWAGIKECLELLDRARRSDRAESGELRAESQSRRQQSLSSELLAPSSVLPTSSPRRLGRFILERELGRGGLGIVYLAHDPQLGRKVALKIPRFQALLDDDLRRRFMREAEAAARLSHPNIVPVYEVGEDNSICYLASEYCPGPTLAQWLHAQQNGVPPVDAASIVLAIAGGVEHAHSRGVLHRDIKPSNVMMSEAIGDAMRPHRWTPKLTDFGMAKLLEQDGGDRTRTGAVIGTLAYMAPEQIEGETGRIDARTDVYALGAILYELLTGTAPYGGQSDVERLRQLLVSEPIAPRKLRRDVPRDLEAVALKCLAHDPAERYATSDDLAADLRRFQEGRPTVARPLAVSARLVKWTRRRPAIAALCVVSIVAAAMVLGINARRIEDADRALEESNQLRTFADQQRQRVLDEQAASRRLLYASRMRKAQQAWRDGKRDTLQVMLQHYAKGTPDAGLRHFEWYYLNYLANLPHRILRGHTGRVYAVAYSPDGQFIVSGGSDGTVRFWDVATAETAAVVHEHQEAVSSLVFAPDGDTFATSSGDKTVKLWSLSQRKPISTLPHPFPVDACAFLDGGKLLGSLSSETDGRRKSLLWDMPNETLRPTWPPPAEVFQAVIAGQSGRTAVTFVKNYATVWHRHGDSWVKSRLMDVVDPRAGATLSPDEEYLLVPVWPRYVHIYRLRDGMLVNVIKDHGGGVNCITFSPRGDQIATSSDDSSVCVFEFPSGKLLHRFFGHQEGAVWQVAWSPSGDSLASVGNDGTIRVWDPQHGSSHLHLNLPESRSRASRGDWGFAQLEESGLWGFAFLEDGQHLSTLYHDGLNLLWDVTTGQSTSPSEVVDVAGVPNDVTAATAGSEEQHKNLVSPFPEAAHALLAQWDAQAYSIPTRFDLGSDGRVARTKCCARIVGDGSQIIEIGNGRLRRWNVHPFSFVGERRIDNLNAPGAPELVFDISRDGRRVCGANVDGKTYVCDLDRGTIVHLGNFLSVRRACFSPNSDRILISHGDGVHDYDAHTGEQIRGYSNELATAMSYSADGQRIAVAFEPGYACAYDTLTGEETLRLDVRASVALFARDGSSIVTDGAPDGGLYYWPGKSEISP